MGGAGNARARPGTHLELLTVVISGALASVRLLVRRLHQPFRRIDRVAQHLDLAAKDVPLALEARPLPLRRLHATRHARELGAQCGGLVSALGDKPAYLRREARERGRQLASGDHLVGTTIGGPAAEQPATTAHAQRGERSAKGSRGGARADATLRRKLEGEERLL